jgi:putative hydrolase of the HAD superfamily
MCTSSATLVFRSPGDTPCGVRRGASAECSRVTAKLAKRAIAFDLWGTLIPFPPGSSEVMLKQIAGALDARYPDLARLWDETWPERWTGDLASYLRRICARIDLRPTPGQLDRVLKIRIDAHRRLFVPRPDAASTLARLRSLGIRTAVVSNTSSEVPPLWRRSSLAGLIDVQVFSCEEGLMKPDRRIFELATRRLVVVPNECLYIGDGADDELEGARAVGMDAVLLRPGDTSPPQHWSGLELASLSQVLTLLDSES